MQTKLTEAVCANINNKMHFYLPKVKMMMDEYKTFKEKVEMKMKELLHPKEEKHNDFDPT